MNKFEKVAETVGKDILKVIEFPFVELPHIVKVLDTIIKDTPEVKADLTVFVQKANQVLIDTNAVINEHGLVFSDDAKALIQVKDLLTYFSTTLLPVIEKVYGELETDIQTN